MMCDMTLRVGNVAQKLKIYKAVNNGTATFREKFTSAKGCKNRRIMAVCMGMQKPAAVERGSEHGNRHRGFGCGSFSVWDCLFNSANITKHTKGG